MKVIKSFLYLGVLFSAFFVAQAAAAPIGAVSVVDNNGVSWGYIPPIANVETLMDNRKWYSVFSPDGEWMVFLGPQRANIYLVPADGGTPVQIYKLPTAANTFAWINEIHFTPNGREITYVKCLYDPSAGSYDANPDSMSVSPRNVFYSIESLNVSTGKNRVILNNGVSCSWSSDGRYLSFINRDPRAYTDPAHTEHHCAPAIYDSQTGLTRFLTDENWVQSNGTGSPYIDTEFSPDGSNIVSSKLIDGKRQLVKIPFDGGIPQQITFFDDKAFIYEDKLRAVCWPRYSPDGKWLVFTVDNTMVIMDTATGKIYDFFSRKPFVSCAPFVETPLFQIQNAWPGNWSPDGKKLVYNFYVTWDKLTNNAPVNAHNGASNTYTVIYDFEPSGFSIPSPVAEALPGKFALTGNYPNPFNPSTTISFSLPVSGMTTLTVYNVSGQKVRELVNGPLSAGAHSVVWDGRDDSGKPVSSGVYLSRLVMGQYSASERMLFAK